MVAVDSFAADITAVASLVTSCALAVSVLVNRRAIKGVHNEVKTSNGLTMAALADRTEGRRIEADIPHGERTASEQHYVEGLGPDQSPTG